MSDKKPTPVERLMAAMDRCAVARGEAQWLNGFRAARGEPQATKIWPKERGAWEVVGQEEAKFRRLAQRLLREARREA